MDIFFEWRKVMGANAGEIMAFTVDFMKQYWKLAEKEFLPGERNKILEAYRQEAMSGTYMSLISVSAEFILEYTGIQMPMEYLLSDVDD